MKVVLNAGTSGLPIAAANGVQQAIEAMLDGMGNAAINQTHQIMFQGHAVNFTITDKNEINYYVRVNSYL
jgi:hypothetical protein